MDLHLSIDAMADRSPFTLVSDRAANLATSPATPLAAPMADIEAAEQMLGLFDTLIGEADQNVLLERFHRRATTAHSTNWISTEKHSAQ